VNSATTRLRQRRWYPSIYKTASVLVGRLYRKRGITPPIKYLAVVSSWQRTNPARSAYNSIGWWTFNREKYPVVRDEFIHPREFKPVYKVESLTHLFGGFSTERTIEPE
jgi:hypothetical protein